MVSFGQYAASHITEKITVGQSGADVYRLDGGHIAKHILRSKLKSESQWNAYMNEARFYGWLGAKSPSFVPTVVHCLCTDDEIQLIMQEYQPLDRSELDESLLDSIMSSLAQIHSLPCPEFLSNEAPEPVQLSGAEIQQCLDGWRCVLRGHGDRFAQQPLSDIAANINELNRCFHASARCLNHGDFHFDNLLQGKNREIVVCDWQNIQCGHPAGDISFFLSRINADGLHICEGSAIQRYASHSASPITPDEILTQMNLANLNTSFIFWHHYLHQSPASRVRPIYEKMLSNFKYLKGH